MDSKDIKFSKKKVDESWKESSSDAPSKEVVQPEVPSEATSPKKPTPTPTNFINFISSLAIQCLMFLGEVSLKEGEKGEINLDAARETIDLLLMLKEKTAGNLNEQEAGLMEQVVADLQMKFLSHSSKPKA